MATKNENKEKLSFALGRENYILLAIGFAIIVVGFLLMLGGKSDDPNVFSEKIFSFRRITLAPIVVLAGFVFEIWAIMKKPKPTDERVCAIQRANQADISTGRPLTSTPTIWQKSQMRSAGKPMAESAGSDSLVLMAK